MLTKVIKVLTVSNGLIIRLPAEQIVCGCPTAVKRAEPTERAVVLRQTVYNCVKWSRYCSGDYEEIIHAAGLGVYIHNKSKHKPSQAMKCLLKCQYVHLWKFPKQG